MPGVAGETGKSGNSLISADRASVDWHQAISISQTHSGAVLTHLGPLRSVCKSQGQELQSVAADILSVQNSTWVGRCRYTPHSAKASSAEISFPPAWIDAFSSYHRGPTAWRVRTFLLSFSSSSSSSSSNDLPTYLATGTLVTPALSLYLPPSLSPPRRRTWSY